MLVVRSAAVVSLRHEARRQAEEEGRGLPQSLSAPHLTLPPPPPGGRSASTSTGTSTATGVAGAASLGSSAAASSTPSDYWEWAPPDAPTPIPPPGAVVVAINGRSIEGYTFEQAVDVLKRTRKPVSVRFRAVTEWPTRAAFKLEAAGLSALFIDDFGGRDLPLLKLSIGKLEGQSHSGQALPWRWLNVKPSSEGVRLVASSSLR